MPYRQGVQQEKGYNDCVIICTNVKLIVILVKRYICNYRKMVT